MGSTTISRWGLVERLSPILFLIGGSLLVAHAAIMGIQAFSDLTAPPDVFGPTGHLVAVVGLLGLYPALADRQPTVARGAGALGAVALGSWAVMTVTRYLEAAGIVSSPSDVLPGTLIMFVFVSTILAYLLFGVAILRDGDGSRTVGMLVLAPGALIAVALVKSAIIGVTALDGFVIGGGFAFSMVVLGYTLRTWNRPADHDLAAGDVTVG